MQHIVNTSEDGWEDQMRAYKDELKPNTCLECIAGEMTGKMFDFIVDKGVVIVYGCLSA